MIFLSSIPRSGSTLLASLLSQRSDTYVSQTSNLGVLFEAVLNASAKTSTTKASGCSDEELYRILKSIIDAKYSDRAEATVIDKGRGWASPELIEMVELVTGEPVKIIATVRPMAECIASGYSIDSTKGNKTVKEWIRTSPFYQHTYCSFSCLKEGYEKYPEKFCLVEYNNLCKDPQKELDKISDFIGVEKIKYNPKIDQVNENDDAWGIPDLHKLTSSIKKTDPDAKEILGEKLFKNYQGGEFWNDKPEPIQGKELIDLELELALKGDFKKAWEIAEQLEQNDPDCDRSAFNRGWHLMSQGKLLEGHKYINRGRNEEVFGNINISSQPLWDGKSKGTILLVLEGGLGDEIHGFRYAQEIKNKGNEVVVACSIELAEVFSETVVCVLRDAIGSVYHDFYVPAMSAPLTLKHEYEDVKGESYIDRTAKPIKGRVGIRWSGLPQFEHQQHRLFPHELMFSTVRDLDCVSLQRDEGSEFKPEWMPQADVSDWVATRKSISECELVITSCTSVAHLAGAMGIETWIVVPILSYYLWALPSDKTPYYNSVKLFRQEKYGWWEAPFVKMAEVLNTKQSKTFEYNLSETLPDPVFM